MRSILARPVRGLFAALGYELRKLPGDLPLPRDFGPEDAATWRAVSPYTMTSPERVYALCSAVEWVVKRGVPGAVVECGVWKGGSMMAVARTLLRLRETRELHLFDTFEGMPEPGAEDRLFNGAPALAMYRKRRAAGLSWAACPADAVREAVLGTGYDASHVTLVPGKVEDTLPARAPEKIALLRLDTDWYSSTAHELEHLFPRLSPGGVLIIDDYGHWQGARRAVDEYFAEHGVSMLLHRTDYTGRIGIKL